MLERYQRHLYQYRKRNGEPLTTRTQRTAVQPIQVWFRWMAQQNLILANSAADLELPRLEKRLPRYILSVDEVEQVLAQPDLTTPGGIRDRALMEVLWSTGIRRSEAAGLEVFTVDASRRILTIVQGKGKQDRVVPVGERALWWVQHYLHHFRPQLLVNPHCKALFVALDGVEGLTPNGITNIVSHHMKASGLVAHRSCHLVRHAMATQMLENGADLRWIQLQARRCDRPVALRITVTASRFWTVVSNFAQSHLTCLLMRHGFGKSFLSLAFSSSSDFRRLTSRTSIPPYFLRRCKKMASEMQCLRQSSRAETLASALRRILMVCSSEKTLLHGDVLVWLMKTLLTS